ncbi:hypothetical protein MAP_2777c [Mycobacterium avium subsp. paratuberculosis K-10]|uniref:Uncharacterized protein n=1 Tax=Mycolicibacterium paratuberculosis (strain ATCC BAA-968 / K-10) TaxID=262316 RepID=Q73W83_MYCPA|nr:hypothetical protein MAP_2777c [Mycobacterium avium subsp. paratuberculosis K-10]AGL35978.1 hypothetical protein MAP4_1035 [Mycobacterium avium subsp. paratuberculosis MAP4]
MLRRQRGLLGQPQRQHRHVGVGVDARAHAVAHGDRVVVVEHGDPALGQAGEERVIGFVRGGRCRAQQRGGGQDDRAGGRPRGTTGLGVSHGLPWVRWAESRRLIETIDEFWVTSPRRTPARGHDEQCVALIRPFGAPSLARASESALAASGPEPPRNRPEPRSKATDAAVAGARDHFAGVAGFGGAVRKGELVRLVLTVRGRPAGGASAAHRHRQGDEVVVGPGGLGRPQRRGRASDRDDDDGDE